MKVIALVCALSFGAATFAPRAEALSRTGRSFLVMGGYGMIGGTVLGVASYPFTHQARTIFIGTSIGLYLGLALGAFYALNDYNPDRPFWTQDRAEADLLAYDPNRFERPSPGEEPVPLRAEFSIARF